MFSIRFRVTYELNQFLNILPRTYLQSIKIYPEPAHIGSDFTQYPVQIPSFLLL